MESAEDPDLFLTRDAQGKHQGALVGVEAVTPEGLKAVYKDFNSLGRQIDTAASRPSAALVFTFLVHSSLACRLISQARLVRPLS